MLRDLGKIRENYC